MNTIRTLLITTALAAAATSGFAQVVRDGEINGPVSGQIEAFQSVRSVQDVKAEAVAAAREEATVGIDNGQIQVATPSSVTRQAVRSDAIAYLHAHANDPMAEGQYQ